MRVLLSGGKKTYNIIDGIRKKFTTSGDDFVVIEYLDDILDMFSRGDYFDKAVIIEQSITRDGAITDEMQIRQRINKFSIDISKKVHKSNYVFLSQDEDIASMIYDEILPIANDSAVVFMKPPYKATFFADLIVKEAADLPREWVFEPELAVPEMEDLGFDNADINEEIDTTDMDLGMDLPEMPTNDIFGGDGYSVEDNQGRISDSLGINEGFEAENIGVPEDLENLLDGTNQEYIEENNDNNSGFGNNFEGGFGGSFNGEQEPWDENGQDSWQGEDTEFLQDAPIETDVMEPIKQSDELPDYTEQQSNTSFISGFDDIGDDFNNGEYIGTQGNDFDNLGMDNQNQTFEGDGFTDTQGENFSNMYGDQSQGQGQEFSDGMYDNQNQGFSGDMYEDAQGQDFDGSMYNGQSQGFDDGMYGDTQQDTYGNTEQEQFSDDMYGTEQMQDNMQGFGGDMYGNEQQDEYQTTMENDMYNGNPAGFDQQSYDQAAMMAAAAAGATAMAASNLNNQVQQPTMQVQKKKGLRGLFSKGQNSQAQYQNMANQLNTAQPVQSWQQDTQAMVNSGNGNNKVDVNYIKQQLRPFASRGNSIVVTGCGGCGTSTVAYNLANIINQLGYTVLLVDMDTEGRTQSYISKTNYDSMEPDGANLMSAVNSSNGISAQESIVKQGFHLLTMGLGTDTAPVSELLHKEKISRFVNLAKTSHNFVIYDVPFNSATGFLSEITYMTDNLVLVADASNWGITKLMLNVCNISLDDMQDTIFSRAQLVFNRYRNLTKLLGKKVRTGVDITKVVDMKVQELIGEDPGFHFEDLHIAGIINDDPEIENGWFDNVQYSDTPKGQAIFLELLEHIVLKK